MNPVPGTRPTTELDRPQKKEEGFTLIVALLVMGILTVLGLSLLFTAETERTMSRNFSGTIQASYAAEAVSETMVRALLFDLTKDNPRNTNNGGWANKYLVVCDVPDETLCLARYGFTPTAVPCYSATPADSCIIKDITGNLTGGAGQWAVDLTYRPVGVTRPPFPNQLPIRLHPDLKEVLLWWKAFTIDQADSDHLNTGTAELGLTSVCVSGCTGGSPVFAQDEIFVTGIGSSAKIVAGRITKSKNPATRAISVRIRGTLLGIWNNALVGGSGGSSSTVIQGDYVIRGGTLMFNEDPTKKVLTFSAANTGIVNNYYETVGGIPTIDKWWWYDAKNCGLSGCDSSNTGLATVAILAPPLAQVLDSDASTSTATVEPLAHHIEHPPDTNPGDDKPGGYHPTNAVDFPGPETLSASVRVNRGDIVIGDSTAGIGREELGTAPGNYWNNVLDIFMNDSFDFQGSGSAAASIWRGKGTSFNQHTKSGTFDLDTGSLSFPKLTDPYKDPATREIYTTYQDFLRPVNPATHPGGWALDLSGINGQTGLNREITNTGLAGGSCWPRGGSPDGFPSGALGKATGEINLAFPADSAMLQGCRPPLANFWSYEIDWNLTTCGDAMESACANTTTSCKIVFKKHTQYGFGTPPAACIDAPAITLYRRSAHNPNSGDATANQLNFDTSSSIDAPPGRAQSTMFNSFAYKLYVDVLDAVETCDVTQSTLNQNNFPGNFPDLFKANIPTNYPDPAGNECRVANAAVPCFAERSAYMDVHIQLPDLPERLIGNASGTNPFPITTGTRTMNTSFRGEGRWLSVRFRPPGASERLTVLSDPRAKTGVCAYNVVTDIADEVIEDPRRDGTAGQGRLVAGTVANTANWELLNMPKNYARAKPLDPNDTTFRNMPTGAYVIALHLPCSDNSSDLNPYKCNRSTSSSYVAPNPSFEGFYTHLIAWSPKYSCWRTNPATFNKDPSIVDVPYTDTAIGAGPPHVAASTASCLNNDTVCPANARNYSWFAESIWQANFTTLWNVPSIYSGTPDGPPVWDQNTSGLLGFKLAMPMSFSPQTGPCVTGLDRRDIFPGGFCLLGKRDTCNVRIDGINCNAGGNGECYSAGCTGGDPSIDADETNCFNAADEPGGDTVADDASDYDCYCSVEADVVYGGKAYGGCTEIFTPLVTRHILELDPDDTTGSIPFKRNEFTAIALQDIAGGQNNKYDRCAVTSCGSCSFRGVDPDLLASWLPVPVVGDDYAIDKRDPNRYERDWPGWTSASFLMGVGQVFTKDGIRFGSPNRACDNPNSCNPAIATVDATACYNCGGPLDVDAAATTRYRTGFYSDPIVYDGRLLLYAGDINHGANPIAAASGKGSGNTLVWFHDHVVPRAKLGCSDFLSVLTTGDIEVRIEKPFVQNKRHLIGAYGLSGGRLRVTSPDATVQHELLGTWVTDEADFGNYTPPVQIVGTPGVAGVCDHVYLPGRDLFAQGELISYVEDGTLPFGF